MVFKKGQKPPKKGQKMSEVEVKVDTSCIEEDTLKELEELGEIGSIEEETPVSTVVENEISNENVIEHISYEDEEKVMLDKKDVKRSSKRKEKVIGTVGNTVVAKPKGRICFEAQVAPVPMFKLPADIRRYLVNHGFSSDVYKRDKEWLEKHGADMEMINKLKDFLTSMN